MSSSCSLIPKLIAFDLDGTIWSPDMYQLWGGGSPFKINGEGTRTLTDRSNQEVRLLGISGRILHDLRYSKKWIDKGTKIAWVSCTDEPSWADECLQKFKATDADGNVSDSLKDLAHDEQIFKSKKTTHFKNLKKKYPDIEYNEMIFFDNEQGNIRTVSTLGVHCFYCPDGMTADIWKNALEEFENKMNK